MFKGHLWDIGGILSVAIKWAIRGAEFGRGATVNPDRKNASFATDSRFP